MGRSGGQTVDTRSTSGLPPKSLGYNGSNELLGRSVASKLSQTRLSPTSENESYRGVATSISNGIILLNNFIISCNWQQMEVPADYPAITITGLIIRWCSYREAESRWDNQNHRGSLLSSYFLFLPPLEDHLHFFFLANKMLHHQLYKLSLTKKCPLVKFHSPLLSTKLRAHK